MGKLNNETEDQEFVLRSDFFGVKSPEFEVSPNSKEWVSKFVLVKSELEIRVEEERALANSRPDVYFTF